jgi:hypothetical protein
MRLAVERVFGAQALDKAREIHGKHLAASAPAQPAPQTGKFATPAAASLQAFQAASKYAAPVAAPLPAPPQPQLKSQRPLPVVSRPAPPPRLPPAPLPKPEPRANPLAKWPLLAQLPACYLLHDLLGP